MENIRIFIILTIGLFIVSCRDESFFDIDKQPPVLIGCDMVTFATNDIEDMDNDGIFCENNNISLLMVALDDCLPIIAPLSWNVKVDKWDDGTIDWEYSSEIETDWRFDLGNSKEYIAPTISGDTMTISIPESIEGSGDENKVTWEVTDDAGNKDVCTTIFVVKDNIPPIAKCLKLATALITSSDCEIELWAIDFNLGSYDYCTNEKDLRFTFGTIPDEDINYKKENKSSNIVFTMDDVNNSPFGFDVYVWDEEDNYDVCNVIITIRNTNENCGDTL